MTLKIGSEGIDVGTLQRALNDNGANLSIDYSLGTATANAAIQYAASKLLIPTPTAVTPTSERVRGIDIYDGDILSDWNQLVPNGYVFCSVKATQSNNLPQHRYEEHRHAAKAAGVISGPYHFPNFDKPALEQAKVFADYVNAHGGLQDDDLPPMLDWEYYPETRGVHRGDALWALTWCREIERLLKRIPMIYSGYFTVEESRGYEPLNVGALAKYPFWLAWYTDEKNIRIPAPWTKFTIWQYSGEALVPGYDHTQNGRGDADIFNGSLDELKAMIRGSIIV